MGRTGSGLSRNIKQPGGAIALAALVVSGTMLLFSPMGGWHYLPGVSMIILGILDILMGRISTWFRSWQTLTGKKIKIFYP